METLLSLRARHATYPGGSRVFRQFRPEGFPHVAALQRSVTSLTDAKEFDGSKSLATIVCAVLNGRPLLDCILPTRKIPRAIQRGGETLSTQRAGTGIASAAVSTQNESLACCSEARGSNFAPVILDRHPATQ
jgi:hypothetical protein